MLIEIVLELIKATAMTDMSDILDFEKYPLDRPGSSEWSALVSDCKAKLAKDGLFNLAGFVKPDAVVEAVEELTPVMASSSFTHEREHNIYFDDVLKGLPADHPVLKRFRTSNRTICADQIGQAVVIRLYEWPPFAEFLSAVMGKEKLWTMEDPLARVNVMATMRARSLTGISTVPSLPPLCCCRHRWLAGNWNTSKICAVPTTRTTAVSQNF